MPPDQFIACGHKGISSTGRICIHLLRLLERDDDPDIEFFVWFDGQTPSFARICHRCHGSMSDAEPDLVTVCGNCFESVELDGYCDGVTGRPVVPERETNLRFEHRKVTLESPLAAAILDIQPIESKTNSIWVAVTDVGELYRIDCDRGVASLLLRLSDGEWAAIKEVGEIPTVKFDPETEKPVPTLSKMGAETIITLHVTFDGHYAAVVNDTGRYGSVIDLTSGQVTMLLDRQFTYYFATNFPFVFFEVDGRTLFVHATNWNRLDIADPATGENLTERPSPVVQRGKDRPAHYLDYFHAGLSVSPGHSWITDWGWHWHPVGVLRAWNLGRWLADNVWESEDGDSLTRFCQRDYYWDGPACWIDDTTFAVWGRGNDEECLIPAVCFYNVETGEEARWFVGPEGDLEFDTYLFSFDEKLGTSIWDIETGDRLLHAPDFSPTGYHQGSKEFITLLPEGTIRLSRVVSDSPKVSGG